MVVAFCPKCGADMKENRFCPSCGTPAQAPPGSQAPPGTPAPAPQAPAPPGAFPGTPQAPPPGVVPAPPAGPLTAPGAARKQSMGALVSGAAGALAMVIAAIGSALPWATVSILGFSQSKGGLSGDGVITMIAALLALAFFAVGAVLKARWPFIIAAVLCAIAAAIGIYDAVDLDPMVSIGVGLWMVMISGGIGLAVAVAGIASPRREV